VGVLEIQVTIEKFGSISKRRDIKRPSWFAVDNDLFSHPDYFKLTPEELKCWLWILCVASKMNQETIRLDSELFAHQALLPEAVFFSTIKKLSGKRLSYQEIPGSVQNPNADVTLHNTTLHNTTKQNTTQHNTTVSSVVKKITTRGCITEFIFNEVAFRLLSNVTHSSQKAWLLAYPDADWIVSEILKANVWIESNPRKAPKDFGRFMANWLSRGYEMHRKGIPSRRPTNSENNAKALSEMYHKAKMEENDVD